MAGTLASPYGEAVSKMERSFLTTALVPTVVFFTGFGAVAVGSIWSFEDAAEWWSARSISEQVVVGMVAAAVIWFVAGLFASNWRKIVRLYEGYPLTRMLPPLDPTRQSRQHRLEAMRRLPGCAWHLRRYSRLLAGDVKGSPAELSMRYAPDQYKPQILPTTIGNVLLAGERYGLDRYGFDATVLWPRLYWTLPEPVQTALERFKEEHQLPLALSFISACFTLASGLLVFVVGGPWNLFLGACLIGITLTVLTYLLAIERTEEYAEQIRTAVDMYHQELQNKWAKPHHDSDEANWFAAARDFVLRGAHKAPDHADRIESEGGDSEQMSVDRRVPVSLRMRAGLSRALLGAGRRLAEERVDRGGTREPDAHATTGGQATELAPNLSGGDRPARGVWRAWEWVMARVRLLWLATTLLLATTAVGTVVLYQQHVVVLVAAAPSGPGQPVTTRTESIPARDLPHDVFQARDVAGALFAKTEIAAGAVLQPDIARVEQDLVRVTLPLSAGTAPVNISANRSVKALLEPCGRILHDVIITDWNQGPPQTATLLVPAEQLSDFHECRAQTVTLLFPAATSGSSTPDRTSGSS